VILEWLKFDEDRKKCLFFIPPSEMQDNYHQVKSYTENIEKRLINAQFKDTVDRGVFRELTQKDLEDCKGLFNYIAMVEAFKKRPYATTLLRICMNSSLLITTPHQEVTQ
jgi:hypothetical protein